MNDLDRPYDPDPLEPGARVRIRLSGECPGPGCWDQPHAEVCDGFQGRVQDDHDARGCGRDSGHMYLVIVDVSSSAFLWDRVQARRGTVKMIEHYARAELERIE